MTWPSGDPAYSAPPPPPMPYQQGPYGQPPASARPPRKSRKGLLVAVLIGVVILGVIAALVVVRLQQKKQDGATNLKVGDCIAAVPNGELVADIPTVGCDQPHAGEVYAVLSIPGTDYPGQATIEQWQNKCPAELRSYAPAPVPEDSVKVFVLYPTEQTWGDGDRAVTCVATTDDKRTGSLKG